MNCTKYLMTASKSECSGLINVVDKNNKLDYLVVIVRVYRIEFTIMILVFLKKNNVLIYE